jgi:PAS domain S-box-containing protein
MRADGMSRLMAGYARTIGVVGVLASVTVLSGWLIGVPALTSLVHDWPQMAPLTAICVALCGAAIFAATTAWDARITIVCAGLATLIGLIRLAVYLFGWHLQLDDLALQDIAAMHGMRPGTMSPATALGYALLGGTVLLARLRRGTRAFQVCGLLAFLVGWLGCERYLYGGAPLVPLSQMAVHTALLLAALALGALTLRRDAQLRTLWVSNGIGGHSIRRLLPAAVLVPVVAGVLYLWAERWLGSQADLSLLTLTTIVTFVVFVWGNATRLERADAERGRMQEALRTSEERTRLIVEAALDAVITIDDAGLITGWNAQAQTLFGRSAAEAVGRVLGELIIPERYREAHRQGLQRYVSTGQGHVLNRRIELAALRKDGREFPVEIAITQIRAGTHLAFSAFVRDITERRRADERLRSQLGRLNLLDQTTRAIGRRQDLNSMFRVVISSLIEHLRIDFGCIALYEPVQGSLQVASVGTGVAAATNPVVIERERIDIEHNGLARCLKGELIYEPNVADSASGFLGELARGGMRALVMAPVGMEGQIFGVLIAARTVPGGFASIDCEYLRQLSDHLALAMHQAQLYTALQEAYEDLRQTQQTVMQQERLRALGQMASGIAHDINNALSPAAIYAETLLERNKSLDEQARGFLTVIQGAVQGAANTVARMREFYRPREQELTLSPVDLNRILQQVTDLTRARWSDMPQERGVVIELKTELAADLPAALGAENEIRDALTNLVLNAVDAMPKGGTLSLKSGNDADTQGRRPSRVAPRRLYVEIGDTGIGMTEEVRSRCLEPFFTTKGERGTGLGLAMVYGMAERHGADLQIDSEPGRGTRVRLIFPAAHPERAAEQRLDGQAHESLRILVVDDDPLLLKSLRDALESDGHVVHAADGGQAGIDEFLALQRRGEKLAAVITDLGMPHVDGRSVADAVKSAAPDMPVILLTGWGHRLKAEPMPEHIDWVLSKPPRLAELRSVLSEATRQREHANPL